jgi:hypothetical protein
MGALQCSPSIPNLFFIRIALSGHSVWTQRISPFTFPGIVLLADFLPHAHSAHSLTSIQAMVLPLCLRTRVPESQLLGFFANTQCRTIVGLWLWNPMVARVDRVNDVAHIQGSVYSSKGWTRLSRSKITVT